MTDQAQVYRLLARLAQDDLVTIEVNSQSDLRDRKVHHLTQAAPPGSIAGSRRRSTRTPCGSRSCCGCSSPDASAPRISPNS